MRRRAAPVTTWGFRELYRYRSCIAIFSTIAVTPVFVFAVCVKPKAVVYDHIAATNLIMVTCASSSAVNSNVSRSRTRTDVKYSVALPANTSDLLTISVHVSVIDADSVALSSNSMSKIYSISFTVSVLTSAPIVALCVIYTDPPI